MSNQTAWAQSQALPHISYGSIILDMATLITVDLDPKAHPVRVFFTNKNKSQKLGTQS